MTKYKYITENGFTLIELLIAIAIIAIIAAIAIPKYSSYISDAKVSTAQSDILKIAAAEQRYYATNNTFSSDPQNLGFNETSFPFDIPNPNNPTYSLNVTISNSTTTGQAYTITATPINPNSGSAIANCGTMTVTSTGLKTNTGSNQQCWN